MTQLYAPTRQVHPPPICSSFTTVNDSVSKLFIKDDFRVQRAPKYKL